MEQIEQLKAIRDAAAARIEAAYRAIEASADAKLASSLGGLILDLETAFGTSEAATIAKIDEPKAPEKPVEMVQDKMPQSVTEKVETVDVKDEVVEAATVDDEFSLEASLEAELMASQEKSGSN